jgi:hypothetical protein
VNRLGLGLAESLEPARQHRIVESQDLGGEDARILRARLADGQGGDRDAAGHLDDGEEAVQALQGL